MESDLLDELGNKNILVKDMHGLIDTLHEHGVYTIVRCVAFRNPYIKDVKPDWMLKTADGEIYEDNKGFNRMDLRNSEACNYLIEVALGCKDAGFDEVQFDYVRFPTGITEEVKEQIKAVNDNGIDSWIIWNPSCKYPWEAFIE